MLNFKNLTHESICKTLMKLGARAVFSSPIHIVLYWMLADSSQMRPGTFVFACFIAVILSTAARVPLWIFGRQIMSSKNGIFKWRILFGIATTCLALGWGLMSAHLFAEQGVTTRSVMVACFLFAIGASSATAYGFDALVNIIFQLALVLPGAYVNVLTMTSHEASTIGFGFFLFFVFITFVAISNHRSEIDNLTKTETIAKQNESLERAHGDLKNAHETVQAMLESIAEAFMIFNDKGICFSNPSQKAKELLGFDPTGCRIDEVLGVSESKQAGTVNWYKLLISGQGEFSDIAKLGPKMIENSSSGLMLSLNFHPMKAEDGRIWAVILTASDVTREMKAKKSAAEAQERAELILRIHENKPGFRSFLADFEKVVVRLSTWDGKGLAEARRDLHTIKGVAGMFSAPSLAKTVHELEMSVRECESTDPDRVAQTMREGAKQAHQFFLRWKQKEERLFSQIGVFDDESIEVSKKRLFKMESQLPEGPAIAAAYQLLVRQLTTCEFRELLEGFEYQVENAAAKLGKKVKLEIKNTGAPFLVAPNAYRDVLRSLVHLFNNAVDHGIEEASVRLAAGKPANGTISAEYGRATVDGRNWLRLIIKDDGGGIDVKRLREKLARSSGAGTEQATDLEVMQQIFNDGVTTRSEVTEISGQGVGMGSLRSTVLKARGRISIRKSDANGTEFEILLPDQSLMFNVAESALSKRPA